MDHAALIDALAAKAAAYTARAAEIERMAATMLKPGEQPTRRALAARARAFHQAAWKCGEAYRALLSTGSEEARNAH